MPLALESNLDCPACDTIFDHVFTFPDRVEVREDITEEDLADVLMTCPGCGHQWLEHWQGWIAHDDAG
jgi:hypothetical protein